MKKKLIPFIVMSVISCSLLAGCTNDSYVGTTAINDLGTSDYASESMTYSDYNYDDYSSSVPSEMSDADIVKSTMMIVRNADINVDVKNLEDFNSNLTAKVSEFGGYFEGSEINNYDNEWDTSRYGYYTVRIPSDKLDAFLNYADEEGSITRKNITSEDVSLEYVDVEAHLNAPEAERDHLKTLLDDAENVSEIIEIEDRLTSVQAQLDSYTSQKRTLENRVSYSTVKITACESRNVEHPIRAAFDVNFKQAMIDGMENAVTTLVDIIASIPVIIIVTSFGILFLWILRKVWRKVFKRDKYGYKYMFMPVAINDEQLKTPNTNGNKEPYYDAHKIAEAARDEIERRKVMDAVKENLLQNKEEGKDE